MDEPFEHLADKYEILERLGKGGMGTIYKVRHRLLDELRVVKMMRASLRDDKDLFARFAHEAKVAIQLRHPQIAQLFDFLVDEQGNASIVMEYIAGLTLEQLLKAGAPSINLSLEIAAQTLRALDYLHRKKFVHRDISPDNLMLTHDDERPLVKLIDLGIAKGIEGEAARFTATGFYLGKVRYSSPEQLEGAGVGRVDGRSDLYSFAVVLYELLTGHYPISGHSGPSWIAGHLYRPPLSFDDSDPQERLPSALRELLLAALAKDPEDRPASAEEFSRRLDKLRRAFPLRGEVRIKTLELIRSRAKGPTASIETSNAKNPLLSDGHRVTTPAPWGVSRTSEPTGAESQPTSSGHGTPPKGSSLEKIAEEVRLQNTERQRQEILTATVERIAAQALTGRLTQAEKLLDDGIATYGDDEAWGSARALLVRSRRRQEAISRIEQYIQAGELDEAQELLDEASHDFGDEPPFPQLQQRLERRCQELLLAQLLDEARRLIERQELVQALVPLRQAAKIKPDDAKTRALLERTEADLERQRKKHKRQQAIRRIEKLFTHGELDAGANLLEKLREEFGDEPELSQRLEELRRAAQVEKLLAEARELAQLDQLSKALERLDLARRISPARSDVLNLFEDVTAQIQRRDEEARKAREIARYAAQIVELLDSGQLEAAADWLELADSEFGAPSEMKGLRARLKKLQAQRRRAQQTVVVEPSPGADEKTVRLDIAETVHVRPLLEEAPAEPMPSATGLEPARRRNLVITAALFVLLFMAGATALWWFRASVAEPTRTAEPIRVSQPVTGRLIINAIPWGRLTAVTGQDGQSHPELIGAYTPVAVSLPPGRYNIRLENDGFDGPKELYVEVRPRETTRCLSQFTEVSIDEFFEQLGW